MTNPKYVRTDEGIREALDVRNDCFGKAEYLVRNGSGFLRDFNKMWVPSDRVRAKADDLPSLFDGFTVVGTLDGEERHKYLPSDSWDAKSVLDTYDGMGYSIHGVIWEGGGLTPVAEYDKGEWTLL